MSAAPWLLDRLIAGSLQAVVLVGVVWTICRLLPRLSAWLMTVVWWLVALKLLLVLVPIPAIPLPLLPEPIMVPLALGDAGLPTAVTVPAGPVVTNWWPITAMVVWFAGLALGWARLLAAYWAARDVVRRATPVELPGVEGLAAAVGLTRVPQTRSSADVTAPQVIGTWRPVIVLPASMPLESEDCRLALGHEFMHVRRRDVALGWIPALAERLFFFHPLVRLAAREYLTAREAACDAALVGALGVDPADYGRLLVRFGITSATPAFAAGGAASSSQSLLRRLDMLQHSPARSSARVAIVLCALLIVAMVPMKLVALSAPALPDAPAPDILQDPAPGPGRATLLTDSAATAAKPRASASPAQLAVASEPQAELAARAAEVAKAADALRLAQAQAADQEARERARKLAEALDARQEAIARGNAADAEAVRRKVEQTLEALNSSLVQQKTQDFLLNDYTAQLRTQIEVLKQQMDAMRDQIRELERALELQKKELAKKK